MRPRLFAQLLLLSLFLVGANVFANPMEEAKHFYGLRENSPHNIKKARALFESVLKNRNSGADKIRAAEYLGRLAYYEGDLLTPTRNNRKRKKIFL